MHSITKSYMLTAVLLLNFFSSVIFLSEGHTFIGVALVFVSVTAALCSFFFNRSQCVDVFAPEASGEHFSYGYYKRKNFSEWLNSNASVITEQSLFVIVVRIITCAALVGVCVFLLFSNSFNYFQYAVLNKFTLVAVIFFAIAFLLFGLRFCAFPTFGVYCFVMVEYFMQKFYLYMGGAPEFMRLFAYVTIIFFITLAVVLIQRFASCQVGFFNIQFFEHKGNVQITDLFLKPFTGMKDYALLYKFTFPKISVIEKDSNKLCFDIAAMAKRHKSVFAGLVCNDLKNCYEMYFYANENNVKENENFEKCLRQFIIKHFELKCTVKNMYDAEWNVYRNLLYPSNGELCEIISRNHIRSLFVKGATFDRDYALTFYVFFKEKKDMLAFEKIVEYYGFTLSYAAFDDVLNNVVAEYPYCGEYKIITYISVHRLEYLNKTLLKAAEDFGCVYLGDWAVEEYTA